VISCSLNDVVRDICPGGDGLRSRRAVQVMEMDVVASLFVERRTRTRWFAKVQWWMVEGGREEEGPRVLTRLMLFV
jgi:hypothetical protein